MKKIYFAGDMISNTGPAIVNKNYYEYLKNDIYICKTNNKIFRFIHFLILLIFFKKIIVSGMSKLHILFIKIGKIFHKKTFYIMHGDNVLEAKINDKENAKYSEFQNELLKSVDIIICVSEMFANYVKAEYPNYADKVTFINNGVELKLKKERKKENSNKVTIMSVGGGMPRKNILTICKALDSISQIMDVEFIVVGAIQRDGEKIKSYNFVRYYEKMSHEDVIKKMQESNIYIQNSTFETFGLAVVEAINEGCKILISKNVGVINCLENISDDNIIQNIDSIEEISQKVLRVINLSNTIELKKEISWENSSKKLLKMVEE